MSAPPQAPARRRRAPRRHSPRLVLLLAAVALAAAAAVGLAAVSGVLGGADDYDGSGSGSVEVTIPEGASLSRIGAVLAEADAVASADAFVDAAGQEPRASTIGPGTYRIARRMSGQAAVAALLDPASRVTSTVVVREGESAAEIAKAVATATGATEDEVLAITRAPSALPLPDYADGRVEGFLFPATYQVDPGESPLEVLTAMVNRFNQAAVELDLINRSQAQGFDPLEVVTMASLVEAEVAPDDFARAARVIRNRLDDGMRLQFDSTVNYAKGTSDLTLTSDDLAVESPYNTYANAGLPPGPIGSPSEAALEAVLDPEQGDWIYFVTVDPANGITRFTSSYAEFLEFKREFQETQR
jgi:UPF0755 protein